MIAWLKPGSGWAWWALSLVLVAGVQQYRVMDAKVELSDARSEWSESLRLTAEANAAVILKQQADRLVLESQLATLDQQRYGELRHAQQQIDSLSAALSDGSQRLSVRASCQAAGVPATTSPSSVDDGAQRVELHPADAAAIVRITGDADACAVKLNALQEWAREVTKGN